VDLVPDPLFLRKFDSTGTQAQTFGSVARNSDNWAAEAVLFVLYTDCNVNNLLYRLSPVKISLNVLRDLCPFSGCQQGKERAGEIHSTHGETSRGEEETA
jgi:hypothetical protein